MEEILSTLHAYIATFEAVPGMRLARTLSKVRNHQLFLLPAGTELTEVLIRQMVVRDIPSLVVEVPDVRSEEQREQDRVRVEAEVRHCFRGADLTQPAIADLYASVLEYRMPQA